MSAVFLFFSSLSSSLLLPFTRHLFFLSLLDIHPSSATFMCPYLFLCPLFLSHPLYILFLPSPSSVVLLTAFPLLFLSIPCMKLQPIFILTCATFPYLTYCTSPSLCPLSFILSPPVLNYFSLFSFLQALVVPTVVNTARSHFGPWGPQSTT